MSAVSRSKAINLKAISAVMRRQLWSLLGNPLGYVFILAFVLATAAALFLFDGDKYFARNIADLGPLHSLMPWLIAVLLPALAMGAWASEREQGTEELLLTLPLSIFDAVLGKYLAVVIYFTVALACSFSNVVVLSWLGTPDWGLIISNYAGWWLAGAAFAALSLLASVVVSVPAIAFVLGLIFSGIVLWGARMPQVEWFDAFNRGVVPLGNIGAAIAVIVAAIGLAVFILASRRWRPSGAKTVWAQALSLVFGLLLMVNLARVASRTGIDADVTSEGLASISATGADVLKDLNEPVTVTAFISAELPPELAVKGKEVLDKLKALERARTGLITVVIKRPGDALDINGVLASREYNLKPRKQMVDSVAGKEPADIFLGAAVTCAGNTQIIDYFDPGLSVEYELIRAVRAVASTKKRVLGIATTDLDINGGFDYESRQMNQPWEIVNEWKKQYDVRPVNLDTPVAADIEVLVVPQPSSLTQPQIENLHASIWSGRPTLLMEDPMPYFSMMTGRSDLIPNQPKKGGNPMAGPDAGTPQKGNIQPLFKGLGLNFDLRQVLWSDYFPSHEFRNRIPLNFVWTNRDQAGIADTSTTTGITGLLLPFPGQILVASDKPAALDIKPLFTPTPKVTWGRDGIDELIQQSPYGGGVQPKEAKHQFSGDRANPPSMAVEISGTMIAAYPVVDPATVMDKTPPETAKKAGIPSAKPVHVIVIADVDFVNNQFFAFYRNTENQFNKQEDFKFLLALRNVQLAANAVDSLFNDQGFLALRTRQPERRPLKRIEDQLFSTQEVVRKAIQTADAESETAQAAAQKTMNEQTSKIMARTDLDDNAKAHAQAEAGGIAQRKLDLEAEQIAKARLIKENEAKIEQRRTIEGFRERVRWLALGTPAIILALLILIVYLRKLAAEKAHVPTARKRTSA